MLVVLQTARCGLHIQEIRREKSVGAAFLVKDFLAFVGALWVLFCCGALSESDTGGVLRAGVASWFLIAVYWGSARLSGLVPGERTSLAATLACAAAPSLV